MKRVTGIGGIFFKANDPEKLRNWYRVRLDIECEKDDGAIFKWRKGGRYRLGAIHGLGPIPESTDYFAPSKKPFMITCKSRIWTKSWRN